MEFEMDAVGLSCHRNEISATACHHVDYLARVFFGEIDRQKLDRLALYTVDLADNDLRLSYLKLEALAAHCLDEHTQMEHASAIDNPLVFAVGFGHTQREVAVKLFLKSLPYMA